MLQQFCQSAPSRHTNAQAVVWMGLFFLALPALALDPRHLITQYRQTVWDKAKGLPQAGAYVLDQSPDGYVWMATDAGLVRFDGQRFVRVGLQLPEFSEWGVGSMVATGDGNVWAVGRRWLFRTRGEMVVRVEPSETVCAARPSLVLRDGKESVLVVDTHGKVCRFQNGQWSDVTPTGNDDVVISSLRTREGDLLLAAPQFVWRVKRGSSGKAEKLPLPGVKTMVQLRDGSIALGGTNGLARLQDGRVTAWNPWPGTKTPYVNNLLLDRHGNLWISHWPEGLMRLSADGKLSRFMEGAVTRGPITSMMEDREGNLWAATQFNGVTMIEDTRVASFQEPEGVDNVASWSVAEDSTGSLWYTTRKGLRRLDHRRVPAPVPSALSSQRTGALYVAPDGAIWVGVATGVARISRDGNVQQWKLEDLPNSRVVTALGPRKEGAYGWEP